MLQMGLLGAWLTFAGRPLFAVHAATTWAWGLSQLQDQQLGGLIMWVIGGFLLTAGALVVLADYLLREGEASVPQASR
jgi:putative membrane protein